MTETRNRLQSLDALPKAHVERNWKTYLFWLIPIAAAGLAGWFIYTELLSGGPTLHIYFKDAQELQAGQSQLFYRGAQIGTVDKIELTEDHQMVEVKVSLDGSASSIAREGSRFWIVRPEIGVEQIRAPRTIVSGNHIAVEPGGGKEQTKFTGLEESPVLLPEAALRIVLLAEKLGSVRKRSPVYYRGVEVGQVVDADLGKTSQTIHITVEIRRHYAPLVRLNSRFWNAGGIHANVSLSGLNVAAQSAEAILSGGIDFATPSTSENEAPPGTTYRLYDKPDDAWLAWSPAIALGDEGSSSTQTTNGVAQ